MERDNTEVEFLPKLTQNLSEMSKRTQSVKIPLKHDLTCLEVVENTLYLGTRDSKVLIFTLSPNLTLSEQRSFYPHCNHVHIISASPSLLVILPLHEQQIIRIWNIDTLQVLHGYRGHQKQIVQSVFLSDGQHIATASHDGTARLWSIVQPFKSDEQTHKFTSRYPLLALAEIRQDTLALGGDDCYISVWNWQLDQVMDRIFAHPGSVLALQMSLPYLVSVGGDSKLKIWQVVAKRMPSEYVQQGKEKQKTMFLSKIKEMKDSLSKCLFACHLNNEDLLLMDSHGNFLELNEGLEATTSNLNLTYAERVRSVKNWQNNIFFVSNCPKGKGQLRHIPVEVCRTTKVIAIRSKMNNSELYENGMSFVDQFAQSSMVNFN